SLVKFSLACSKIFPSTQTEQNLGHFTSHFPRCCSKLSQRKTLRKVAEHPQHWGVSRLKEIFCTTHEA
ncbi:hypothetical protein B1A61_11305, partial [Corynebacterium diphtheriae]